MFAHFGLVIARLAVWLAVGVFVPTLLLLLSPIFGRAMQRASSACVRASERADRAIKRASSWLAGYEDDGIEGTPTEEPRVRVGGGIEDRGSTTGRWRVEDEAASELDDPWDDGRAIPDAKRKRTAGTDEDEDESRRR
jgi:hypothetical protein